MARGGDALPTGEATADRYLKYISAILPTYYFRSPHHGRHVRVPQAYAIMVGMNRLLLEGEFKVVDEYIVGPTWPTQAAFQQMLNQQGVWNRGDTFLYGPLREMRNLGYLATGRQIQVTKSGLDLLVRHAITVHAHFAGRELAASAATYRAWLELNSKIFDAFFLGDFGEKLIIARNAVNRALAQSKKTESTVDPLSAQPARWIILNLVGLYGECSSNEFGRIVLKYGLELLAPGATQIGAAEREFVKADVFDLVGERPFRKYRLTPSYRTLLDAMIATIDSGLSAIEAACLHFEAGKVAG